MTLSNYDNIIDVTCAIIRNDDGEVLVVQRDEKSDHPLKWEFPGGKINSGESAEDCIVREIDEELSLDFVITGTLPEVEHDYGQKKIRLIPFVCDTLIDLPILHEHKDFKWVEPNTLLSVDFCEADLPVAARYISKFALSSQQKSEVIEEGVVDEDGIREILNGNISIPACNLIAESALDNPAILSTLFKFSLSDEPTLAFRSSWTLTKVAEIDRSLLEPYLSDLVISLKELKSEAVIRSFLKIIIQSDFNNMGEKEQGIVASRCFDWLNSAKSAIAIKAYSMEALYNLTLIYPELIDELTSSLTRVMDGGSAGVKARGRLIIEKMSKNNQIR